MHLLAKRLAAKMSKPQFPYRCSSLGNFAWIISKLLRFPKFNCRSFESTLLQRVLLLCAQISNPRSLSLHAQCVSHTWVNCTGTRGYACLYAYLCVYTSRVRTYTRFKQTRDTPINVCARLYSRLLLLNWRACRSIHTCDYQADPRCVFATEMERHSVRNRLHIFNDTRALLIFRRDFARISFDTSTYARVDRRILLNVMINILFRCICRSSLSRWTQ